MGSKFQIAFLLALLLAPLAAAPVCPASAQPTYMQLDYAHNSGEPGGRLDIFLYYIGTERQEEVAPMRVPPVWSLAPVPSGARLDENAVAITPLGRRAPLGVGGGLVVVVSGPYPRPGSDPNSQQTGGAEYKICRLVTDAQGKASAMLAHPDGGACIEHRAVFCPFTSSEEDLFACARLPTPNNLAGYNPDSRKLGWSSIPPCEGASGGTDNMVQDLRAKFRDWTAVQRVCNEAPSGAQAQFCWLLAAIFGLLFYSAIMTGRNPLMFLDWGAARSARYNRSAGAYTPMTQSVSMNVSSMVSAADKAAGMASDFAGSGFGKKRDEETDRSAKAGGRVDAKTGKAQPDAMDKVIGVVNYKPGGLVAGWVNNKVGSVMDKLGVNAATGNQMADRALGSLFSGMVKAGVVGMVTMAVGGFKQKAVRAGARAGARNMAVAAVSVAKNAAVDAGEAGLTGLMAWDRERLLNKTGGEDDGGPDEEELAAGALAAVKKVMMSPHDNASGLKLKKDVSGLKLQKDAGGGYVIIDAKNNNEIVARTGQVVESSSGGWVVTMDRGDGDGWKGYVLETGPAPTPPISAAFAPSRPAPAELGRQPLNWVNANSGGVQIILSGGRLIGMGSEGGAASLGLTAAAGMARGGALGFWGGLLQPVAMLRNVFSNTLEGSPIRAKKARRRFSATDGNGQKHDYLIEKGNVYELDANGNKTGPAAGTFKESELKFGSSTGPFQAGRAYALEGANVVDVKAAEKTAFAFMRPNPNVDKPVLVGQPDPHKTTLNIGGETFGVTSTRQADGGVMQTVTDGAGQTVAVITRNGEGVVQGIRDGSGKDIDTLAAGGMNFEIRQKGGGVTISSTGILAGATAGPWTAEWRDSAGRRIEYTENVLGQAIKGADGEIFAFTKYPSEAPKEIRVGEETVGVKTDPNADGGVTQTLTNSGATVAVINYDSRGVIGGVQDGGGREIDDIKIGTGEKQVILRITNEYVPVTRPAVTAAEAVHAHLLEPAAKGIESAFNDVLMGEMRRSRAGDPFVNKLSGWREVGLATAWQNYLSGYMGAGDVPLRTAQEDIARQMQKKHEEAQENLDAYWKFVKERHGSDLAQLDDTGCRIYSVADIPEEIQNQWKQEYRTHLIGTSNTMGWQPNDWKEATAPEAQRRLGAEGMGRLEEWARFGRGTSALNSYGQLNRLSASLSGGNEEYAARLMTKQPALNRCTAEMLASELTLANERQVLEGKQEEMQRQLHEIGEGKRKRVDPALAVEVDTRTEKVRYFAARADNYRMASEAIANVVGPGLIGRPEMGAFVKQVDGVVGAWDAADPKNGDADRAGREKQLEEILAASRRLVSAQPGAGAKSADDTRADMLRAVMKNSLPVPTVPKRRKGWNGDDR